MGAGTSCKAQNSTTPRESGELSRIECHHWQRGIWFHWATTCRISNSWTWCRSLLSLSWGCSRCRFGQNPKLPLEPRSATCLPRGTHETCGGLMTQPPAPKPALLTTSIVTAGCHKDHKTFNSRQSKTNRSILGIIFAFHHGSSLPTCTASVLLKIQHK